MSGDLEPLAWAWLRLEIEEAGESALLWDSIAIAETLAERHPEAGHWPDGTAAKAALADSRVAFQPMSSRRDRRR